MGRSSWSQLLRSCDCEMRWRSECGKGVDDVSLQMLTWAFNRLVPASCWLGLRRGYPSARFSRSKVKNLRKERDNSSSRNLRQSEYKVRIILPVVFYGFETWSLIFREERRLRMFENRMLRRIFGPKRDEVTREWKKPNNEELNDLYSSPNIFRVIKFRRIRWAGHVARMG